MLLLVLQWVRIEENVPMHLYTDAKILMLHGFIFCLGGMGVLQFSIHFPSRYDRAVAICTTAQTSPSTQALRSVQRAAVKMDPKYKQGNYKLDQGPAEGMGKYLKIHQNAVAFVPALL